MIISSGHYTKGQQPLSYDSKVKKTRNLRNDFNDKLYDQPHMLNH